MELGAKDQILMDHCWNLQAIISRYSDILFRHIRKIGVDKIDILPRETSRQFSFLLNSLFIPAHMGNWPVLAGRNGPADTRNEAKALSFLMLQALCSQNLHA